MIVRGRCRGWRGFVGLTLTYGLGPARQKSGMGGLRQLRDNDGVTLLSCTRSSTRLSARSFTGSLGAMVVAVIASVALAGPVAAAELRRAPLAPGGLTVGDQARPLDVAGAPLFGWLPRDPDPGEVQTAYQIRVWRSGPAGDKRRAGPVWDSGRVASGRQEYVPYAGPILAPGVSYTWRVRTWDRGGLASPWSRTGEFDTGLGDADWQASWIRRTSAEADDYTLARKDFTVGRSPVVRARVHVAACHQYALHLNGRVIDRGAAFNYPDDGYYRTVDVTSLLPAGRPATIGALYHWYGPGQGRPRGEPGLLIRLVIDHADGGRETVVTDGSWRVSRGPWKPAPLRNGDGRDYIEEIDGTAEPLGWDRPGFDATGWSAPQVVGTHPAGVFTGLRGQETALSLTTLRPLHVSRLPSGAVVADFGAVIPAVPVVRFRRGVAGRHVAMRAGYLLAADGGVSRDAGDNQDTDLSYGYTQRAGDQTFRAFTYEGFRYFEIDDPQVTADDIAAVVQHTDVPDPRPARFTSSNPGVDAAYGLMARSALYGAQEQFLDTPTREKGQFLGDAADISLATMSAFGERRLTRRAIGEFIASQARYWPDGRLNAVYPNGDGGRDIPDYTEMFPGWVWDYYLRSGDQRTLAAAYPAMRAIAGYVRRHVDAGTGLVTNLSGGSGPYQFGIIDWPETMRYGFDMDTAARTPVNILAVDALTAAARAAETLGRTDEAAESRRDARALTTAINTRLRRTDGIYADGLKSDGTLSTHASQIANAYALAYGIAPTADAADAADAADTVDVAENDRVGDHVVGLGMQMGPMTAHRLLAALADRPEQVIARLTDTRGHGWGNILARGGTFTWESWDAPETGQSLSHSWGATALVDIQQTLLGVTVTAPAGAQVRIRPPAAGLDRASGTVPTQRGPVSASWAARRPPTGAHFSLTIDIPVNVRAQVHVPARAATDVRVTGPGRARFLEMRDGHAVFAAGSGRLTFQTVRR
jgi:alpha-L-rhamnosidase